MAIGVLAGGMTPEFGNALIIIDCVALALFLIMIYSRQIAAGLKRVFGVVSHSLLASRIRMWRTAHKAR